MSRLYPHLDPAGVEHDKADKALRIVPVTVKSGHGRGSWRHFQDRDDDE